MIISDYLLSLDTKDQIKFVYRLLLKYKNFSYQLFFSFGDAKIGLYMAKIFLGFGVPVPTEIEKLIIKCDSCFYRYFDLLLRHKYVFSIVMEDYVSKIPWLAVDYAIMLFENNLKKIPEKIRQSIISCSNSSLKYSFCLLRYNKKVPIEYEISISKSFDNSYKYAVYLINHGYKVPKIIEKSIISYTGTACDYAKFLLSNNNMEVSHIEPYIESYDAYSYACFLLSKNLSISEHLEKEISKNSALSYFYITELLKYRKKIPKIVVESVLKHSLYAWFYAELLKKNKQEVLNIIE